ncbi:MAG: hypothetical protein ACR2H3_03200 [Acidimicrobiales bacterium]
MPFAGSFAKCQDWGFELAEEMSTLVSDDSPVPPGEVPEQLLAVMSQAQQLLTPMITNFVALLREWEYSWEAIAELLADGRDAPAVADAYASIEGQLPRPVIVRS